MADPRRSAGSTIRTATIVRVTLVAGALVVLALLAWQLAQVILLGFAAVLVAIILRSLAALIERYTPVGERWSLPLAVLIAVSLVAGFGFLIGTQVRTEVAGLMQRLPDLVDTLGNRLNVPDLREQVTDRLQEFAGRGGVVQKVAGYTSIVLTAVAHFVLVLIAGIYLAAAPKRYRAGLLQLVPGHARPRAEAAFDNAGKALRLWLAGQLVSMLLVGVVMTVGLMLIGVPSALALGFLAALAEFVPLVGPVVGAIPVVLVAASEGGNAVFWALGLVLLLQQVEGNVITPIVQRHAVDLPPVVTLFGILAMGVLFGPLGVVLGTPLTVVLFVAVKHLYVREALGEVTDVPGEDK